MEDIMLNNLDIFNKRLEALYKAYPVLKQIDDSDEIIRKNVIFKNLLSEEYLKTDSGNCIGMLFVINGIIKVQKVTEDGDETNLYNVERGQLCHEALSCFVNCQSLNIEGRAIQDSLIAILPSDIVKRYLLNDSRFMQIIYRDLYAKFRGVIENKEERIHESIEKRLIKLLISKDTKIIYTTHGELAFELDSSREVISRKLKQLEKKGYLLISRGKIQILKDLEELYDI
jgi:CRP/FNR family transcriptional regulator